jgi:multicomponent Na+:H+ antiporter subunit G
MIAQFVHWLSWLCLVAGSFFTLAGAIGLVRMPEVFTRMHAASVIDTLGAGLLIAGMVLQAGLTLVAAKLLLILGLIFFTGPVITHALAQAAVEAGLEPKLAEDRSRRLDEAADGIRNAPRSRPRRAEQVAAADPVEATR